MASKKKSPKRAPRKKPRPAPYDFNPAPVAPAPEPSSGMNFAPLVIFILILAGLYFIFRKDETPVVHKVAAGLQEAAATPVPVVEAPTALPAPTPQKRSTSPAGPRVWDQKKIKSPTHFKIVREEGGVAEVHIFKSGNQPVIVLRSEKGPRGTVTLNWDGKDASGKKAGPGTYYARISGAHGDMVEEIVVK